MWSSIICAPHLILFVSAIQKDEMVEFELLMVERTYGHVVLVGKFEGKRPL
jgi:hypothetical protein